MKYYGIVYTPEINSWNLVQSKGFASVEEAQNATDSIMSWSDDKRRTNIIHEMWVECLSEWPTPEEQDEASLRILDRKNQELSLQNQ